MSSDIAVHDALPILVHSYVYTNSCMHIILFLKIYIKPFFFGQCYRFICRCIFFLANVTSKTLSFLQVAFFSWVDIIKVPVMLSTTSQSSSTLSLFFNKENTSVETETKLDFISSIWDDDHILRLVEKLARKKMHCQIKRQHLQRKKRFNIYIF